jgi:two-component system OmpR family response regulator
MPRALIAEDDSTLADSMAHALRESGYAVDRVEDGAEALLRLGDHTYDLLVLELHLPAVPGERLLESTDSALPVLVVTGLDGDEQLLGRLAGRAVAALRKPFALVEFEARVRMVVRSGGGSAKGAIHCGRLTLEPAVPRALCDGAPLELSPREFELLRVFVTAPGRLASRGHLTAALASSESAIGDAALDVYIHRLRRKLEPCALRIATVRGVGYCLRDAADVGARPPTPACASRSESTPEEETS